MHEIMYINLLKEFRLNVQSKGQKVKPTACA